MASDRMRSDQGGAGHTAEDGARCLRIALVLSASTGGIGRHVASLASHFVTGGHQVTIFAPPVTVAAQHFDTLGATIRPLSALRLARRADVIHAHGYKAGALAAAVSRAGGPPLVVTWHNAILGARTTGRRSRPGMAGRSLQRLVARAADLTLGASTDLVRAAQHLGARRARLGPVAAPTLRPTDQSQRQTLRAGLGVNADDVMILTVTRLAPQKNLAMLLEIAERLRHRRDLRFLVAGDGPLRDDLWERIEESSLPVDLLGRRSDIAELLAAADMTLLTSTWEARALVAQEALLAGVPLISTRVGGIEELVGDDAVLVALDDVSEAAEAVERLADDPDLRTTLGAAGRGRATDWPGEAEVAENVLAAYHALLTSDAPGQ